MFIFWGVSDYITRGVWLVLLLWLCSRVYFYRLVFVLFLFCCYCSRFVYVLWLIIFVLFGLLVGLSWFFFCFVGCSVLWWVVLVIIGWLGCECFLVLVLVVREFWCFPFSRFVSC